MIQSAVVLVLLAGLLLRGLTPLGYMPAAPGSGMLFELCPEQMPMAYSGMSASRHSHHHHDGDSSQETRGDTDLCKIGHLLFSAIASGDNAVDISPQGNDTPLVSLASPILPQRTASNYQSRAPPA